MNDYKVYENQTLLDIAAHFYGRADVAVDLALLNNLSITEKLDIGKHIKLVDAPINILVKKALDSRKIIPSTNLNLIDIPDLGIGSMAIGSTFIIN